MASRGGFYLTCIAGTADEDNESSPEANAGEEIVVGVLAVVALVIVLVAVVWMLSRSILQGVELSESELIAHGFFRTRRYARESIDHAEGRNLRFFEEVLFIGMSLYFDRTLSLSLRDGTKRTLLASSGNNTDHGANVINAWLAAPHATSDPESGGH